MNIATLIQKKYKQVLTAEQLAEFATVFNEEIATDAFGAVVTKVQAPAEEINITVIKNDEWGTYYKLTWGDKEDLMRVDVYDEEGVTYWEAMLTGHVY